MTAGCFCAAVGPVLRRTGILALAVVTVALIAQHPAHAGRCDDADARKVRDCRNEFRNRLPLRVQMGCSDRSGSDRADCARQGLQDYCASQGRVARETCASDEHCEKEALSARATCDRQGIAYCEPAERFARERCQREQRERRARTTPPPVTPPEPPQPAMQRCERGLCRAIVVGGSRCKVWSPSGSPLPREFLQGAYSSLSSEEYFSDVERYCGRDLYCQHHRAYGGGAAPQCDVAQPARTPPAAAVAPARQPVAPPPPPARQPDPDYTRLTPEQLINVMPRDGVPPAAAPSAAPTQPARGSPAPIKPPGKPQTNPSSDITGTGREERKPPTAAPGGIKVDPKLERGTPADLSKVRDDILRLRNPGM
jgi:hypothetical protein